MRSKAGKALRQAQGRREKREKKKIEVRTSEVRGLKKISLKQPPAPRLRRVKEDGGQSIRIQSPNLLLTKGLILGSPCSGEVAIINQKTHREGRMGQ